MGAIGVAAAALSSGQVGEPEAPEAPRSGVVVAPQPTDSEESSFWDRVWVSGQINSITQYHPGFHAPYTGPTARCPLRKWPVPGY